MKKFINRKRTILALAVILTLAGGMEMVSSVSAAAKLPTVTPKGDMSYGAANFYQSNKVQHQKVSFKNIYNMKVVGNLYLPKNYQQEEKLPAIVVGHPRPMLFITGETAHSKEFSEDGYKRAAEPKELYYVKDAGHVDLYDRVDYIPFAKLISFFDKALK